MESPIFRGIGRHYVLLSVEKPGVCARRSGTVTRVESNRLVGAIESISRDFDATPGQAHGENSCAGQVSRRVCRADCGVSSRLQSPATCAKTRDTGCRPL